MHEIKKALEDLGFEKVREIERDPLCLLLLLTIEGREVLVEIAQGTRALYAKIVPADRVPPSYWKCGYLGYVPNGLYAFADNVAELARRISDKVRRLIKR